MFKRWAMLLMLSSLLSACGGLPSQDGRTTTQALLNQAGADTGLGKALQPLAAQHPGLSGVSTLADPLDAFASRVLLIAAAQRAIDVQYYIWRDDITGNLMLRALQEAAQRGARVRLLLDDNGTNGLDEKLALLNRYPNVEVRLFNPFPQRRLKPLGFVTEFKRLNRRMHNKSLTIDGQVTVVGGRNIGDEYFAATQGVAFSDLDVLVVGDVVDQVSQDFDLYWNSASAYPIERLLGTPADDNRPNDIALLPQPLQDDARTYLMAIAKSEFIQNLVTKQIAFEWVPVRMVSDDPAKVLNTAPRETMLLARLSEVLHKPQHSLDLISPYFVPTQQGVEAFAALAKQGVKLRILTNAMEATDVVAVHAGYAKYREPLLREGIGLFEMRRHATPNAPKEKAGPFGSSGSSLHAKTFAVDGTRVFVGSFNFDPRSASLNTELGFLIESEAMAKLMAQSFDQYIPTRAYELALDQQGKLIWQHQTPQGLVHLDTEPSTSWWQRAWVRFLGILPIEPLL